jgi:hypothetical protein
MNKSRKIIITTYLFFLVLAILIGKNLFLRYIVFGWIPFFIAYFIWREKKN